MKPRALVFRGKWRGKRKKNPWLDGPPTWYEARMCFGKQLMNKQQALQTAARMRKHLGAPPSLEEYRCPVCGKWHVGNNPRWMEQ
jgi:hypothetical protein